MSIANFRALFAKPAAAIVEPAILIDGVPMPVRIRRAANARTYRLTVLPGGDALRLSIPARASLTGALSWAQGHADWVCAQLANTPAGIHLRDGAIFPLEGRDVQIMADPAGRREVVLDGDRLRVGGPVDTLGPRVLRWLKARAKRVLERETRALARAAGLPLGAVGIGDPRSRWGSCASSGAIRYSWRLILAPPHVRRATVAHEVAHLAHMDHSPAFHAAHRHLLGEDPKPARAWLKAHGAALHRVGL